MTEMQEKLTEMMTWLHGVCVKYGIKYYALGGTALGAVRHKGFIPWDDDIDIGMPREEINKLINAVNKENNTQYVLETPTNSKDFVYAFPKLYDTTTTLVENTRYKTKRGLYIDIFPLDGIGNSYEESVKNFQYIHKKKKWYLRKICGFNKQKSFIRNSAIFIARCVPNFLWDWKKNRNKLLALSSAKKFEEYNYVVNMFGAWGAKEITEREVFGEPKLCKFENIEIYVPNDTDKYLTGLYGDYMKLPPIEKQKSHHDFLYLDLNKGYME